MSRVLLLEPFSRVYLDKSFHWCNDPEIQDLTNGASITKEEQEKWYRTLQERNDYKIWGVSCDGQPIGACGLKNIDNEYAEYFGYIGEKKYWGGLGVKLVTLMEYEARGLHIARIYLKVLLSNTRAKHLYEKMSYILYREDNIFGYYYKDLD